jgi:hypothetical protein
MLGEGHRGQDGTDKWHDCVDPYAARVIRQVISGGQADPVYGLCQPECGIQASTRPQGQCIHSHEDMEDGEALNYERVLRVGGIIAEGEEDKGEEECLENFLERNSHEVYIRGGLFCVHVVVDGIVIVGVWNWGDGEQRERVLEIVRIGARSPRKIVFKGAKSD